jgi:hypothetical protein
MPTKTYKLLRKILEAHGFRITTSIKVLDILIGPSVPAGSNILPASDGEFVIYLRPFTSPASCGI